MKFLNNFRNKNLPITSRIKSSSEDNINQLLINYLKTQELGFTWNELLVAIFIIILGILGISGIIFTYALLIVSTGVFDEEYRPAEGKNDVGMIIRAQQAYYFEKHKFATNYKELGISIPDINYNSSMVVTENAVYSYAIFKEDRKKYNSSLPSFSGAIFVIPIQKDISETNQQNKVQYLRGVCIINEEGVIPRKPILKNGVVICPENMTLLP